MATAADPGDGKIDIGRVVSRGFETLGRHAIPFIGMTLLLSALPTFAAQYLLLGFIAGVDPVDPQSAVDSVSAPYYWLSPVISLIFGYVLQAALVRSSIVDQAGHAVDHGRSIAVALRLLLPMIGLAIANTILIGLGLLLLVVPGIIVYIMLIVAVPALVEERRGVFASMSRSRRLTKGSRGRIFGLILLFLLFYFVLAGLVGAVFTFGSYGDVLLTSLASAFSAAFTLLLMSVMLASLYRELRMVKEGASSERLAEIFE